MYNSKKLKEKKHKARRRSIREGIFATMHFSLGSQYISPFAIAINTSNSLVALLGSISGLLGPISQMSSSRLMERYSRKKIVLKAVLLESFMWLPFIAIAVLYFKGLILNLLPLLLLLAFAVQIFVANMAGPAWFSWMGDIVDEDFRGRWFAKRNLILGFIGIILSLIASFFLDYFKKILKKGYYFSFWDFVVDAKKTNFGKFALFRTFLSFAQAIAAPLIAVYLLRTLKFNYTTYMIIILAGSVVSLFTLALWGKIADTYGNYKVILISSFLIPTIPILWILSPNPIYLILIPSIIGGIAWTGFNLSAGNFIYDNVSAEKRGLAVSYKNMLIGIGTFLGAGLGAILIKYLTTEIIKPITIIFIISGILRMLAVLFWIPKIKEVRKTKRLTSAKALRDLILKQTRPTLIEETHQLMSIKKYIFDKK